MATQHQIDSFYRFAMQQLAGGNSEQSMDELYDQWRYETAASEELETNVAAIQAAIDDMHAGDTGRDAVQIEQELRDEFNLPATE